MVSNAVDHGTSVELSFTETNVSGHTLSVSYGPIDDGFTATMAGHSVWVSNAGPQPQFLELKTLAPGQSVTVTATWDGHSNTASGTEGPLLKGSFQVSNELDPSAVATVIVGEKPVHGSTHHP